MVRAELICGKIACGKTTVAEKLRDEGRRVILSVDEITLSLFDENLGDQHEIICARAQGYLFEMSLKLIEKGVSPILDWGFWTKKSRDEAEAFFASRNIPVRWHYVCPAERERLKRIDKRNALSKEGKTQAYFVTDAIFQKCEELFETPEDGRMDVIHD